MHLDFAPADFQSRDCSEEAVCRVFRFTADVEKQVEGCEALHGDVLLSDRYFVCVCVYVC